MTAGWNVASIDMMVGLKVAGLEVVGWNDAGAVWFYLCMMPAMHISKLK